MPQRMLKQAGALCLLLLLSLEGAIASTISNSLADRYQDYAEAALHLGAVRSRQESASQQGGSSLKQALDSTQPGFLRVRVVYHLNGTYLSRPDEDRLQNKLVPGAVAVIQKYLQVRIPRTASIRMSAPTKSGEGWCLQTRPTELWTGDGISGVDLVLFVTAKDGSDCSDNALAYSAPCLPDPLTGRPLAAGLNICPRFFQDPGQSSMSTLVHELMHGMGFTSRLMPTFYDQATGISYGLSNIINMITPDGRQLSLADGMKQGRQLGAQAYFITPRIRDLARDFFGCPSLPGAPVDMGSDASHFKQRVFGSELMIPTTTPDGRDKLITNFTLAFMEDTGWYVANKALAQFQPWGSKAGCSFVYKGCNVFAKEAPQQTQFCAVEQRGEAVCTQDARAVANCGKGPDEGCLVPAISQSRGAALDCTDSNVWSSRAPDFQNLIREFGGATGDGTSRCYSVAERLCQPDSTSKGKSRCFSAQALCFQTRCSSSGQVSLVLQLGGQTSAFPCPTGTVLDLSKLLPGRFSGGKVRCPDNQLVCDSMSCSGCGYGQCRQGQCLCKMEFTGQGCWQSLVPQ